MMANDAEAVGSLFQQVLFELPYYNQEAKAAELKRHTPALLIETIVGDPASILVAKDGSQVVGYAFNREDDGLIWLAWFGVASAYRQMGVGRALLQRLDDRARSSGAHKIWCDCRTNNTPSKLTLIGHGFSPLCTVRKHWHGQDFILWEKFVN